MFNSSVNCGEIDFDEVVYYEVVGICLVGQINYIDDCYVNFDKCMVSGYDLGVYYLIKIDYGCFKIDYNVLFLDKFE